MSEAPEDDLERLAVLRRYEILDTLPEPQFDNVAELARALFEVPIAAISLVDEGREWFKARLGLVVQETPRQRAFGAQVVRGVAVLVVADAHQDEHFRNNPLVAGGPQIRFYAGAPLRTADGFNLGALAVMDPLPRHDVTARQMEMLARLASVVVREIEAGPRAESPLRTEQRYRRIVEAANEGIWVLDADERTTYVNTRMAEMLLCRVDEMLGRPISEFMEAAARQQHERTWVACKSGASSRHEFRFRRRDGTEHWTLASVVPINDANGFAGALAMFIDISDRKAAERALQEREANFRYLFEANPNPMWVYDDDTLKFLDVNDAAIGRYGFSRAEFLAMRITDICQVEESARLIADPPMDRSGLRPGGERRHRTKAGGLIDVETSSSTIRFSGRDAVLEVVHDITDRKRAEAALCESEALLKDAQRRAKQAYWFWDPATQTYTFADSYREIIGAELMEDVRTDEGFLRFVHEADRDRVTAALQRGRDDLERQDIEYRVRRADGRVIWLREICEPELDAAGRPRRLLGIVQDISDQKRAAEALQESEMRLRQAGRIAKFGHWLWVADVPGDWAQGHSEYSAEAAAMLGRDPADLDLGTVDYCERIIHPEDGERVRLLCDRMNDICEATYTVEYRIVRPDGEIRDVLEFAENTYDALGRIVSTTGTIQDVTERKRMEDQRLKLVHMTRVGILGEISGVLAHELNQPLAAILSNAQAVQRLLAQEAPDLGETRVALNDIVEADKRADDVIERLGALLRRGEAQFRPLNLNSLVNDVLDIARGDLTLRGVTTDCRLTPNLPAVRGDCIQLQQVLLNLIENACEAMGHTAPRERVLTISTALGDNRTIQMGVTDRGSAIAPNMQEKLFEPFVTTKTHGLGLGLPICHSIIRVHGGHMWGVNNPGRGATFLFALPIYSEERA